MTRRRFSLVAIALFAALLPGVVAAQSTDTVVYYHTDAIGSVRAITDASGQTLARYDFLPFGGEGPPTPDNHVPIQFAGKERDFEIGFDYFGARYYESVSGRFTSVDPVVPMQRALLDPQLWNRYAYVRDNPLRYTDPDGRCIWDLCISEVALVLGVSEAAVVTSAAASAATVTVWNNREEIAHSVIELGTATGSVVRGLLVRSASAPNVSYAKSDSGKGLRDAIAEHEKRLADYIADPDAHDNRGFLKDATPERRAKIINTRIRELKRQIEDFKRQLEEQK